jgi:hypothetical protein
METPAWIVALGVLGTWCMFVAAIWGEKIRSSLFKPELRVVLESPRGLLTTEIITSIAASVDHSVQISPQQVQQYKRSARYYYVSAINARRWPVAHNVRVLVTRLETVDPAGMPRTVWTGEIPLQWEHAQVHPSTRTLGRPARADLMVVAKDTTRGQNELHLMTVIEPTNFIRSYLTAVKLWVTVVATADEVDSAALRLAIAWDGQWNSGDVEMSGHLVISAAT